MGRAGSRLSPDGAGDGDPGEWRLAPLDYYRDVCLARLTGPAWVRFVGSYGERPRAWVLQLLALSEREFERLRLEPGADDREVWNQSFDGVPERLEDHRRRLLAVYSPPPED